MLRLNLSNVLPKELEGDCRLAGEMTSPRAILNQELLGDTSYQNSCIHSLMTQRAKRFTGHRCHCSLTDNDQLSQKVSLDKLSRDVALSRLDLGEGRPDHVCES
jgi:hypothetical protein